MPDNYLFQVLDHLPEPRLVLDGGGTVIKSNKPAFELLGEGKTELEGTAFVDLLSFDSSPNCLERYRIAITKASDGDTAIFRASRDPGQLRDYIELEFLLIPIPASDDNRVNILTIVRDITEYGTLRRRVSKDAQLMTSLLNAAPVFVVALDHEARILLMNRPMSLALGGSGSDDLRGKDYISIVVPPEERDQVSSRLARAFSSDRSAGSYSDVSIRKVAGRLIEWHLSLVHDDTDEEEFVLVVGVDITQRFEAERLAKSHEQRIAQAVRLISLGTVIVGCAHELNNPNSFIRLNANNLSSFWHEATGILDKVASSATGLSLRGIPYERARELVGKMIDGILKGSDQIARIATDLRLFAKQGRAEDGKGADVNAAINASLRIIADLIARSTDRFSLELGEDLPLVPGDNHILEIVISNIVNNACQALTDRQQRICVSSTCESDGWVSIRIADEGGGISMGNVEHIFEPFFTTKQDQGGLGIGLSVCYDIVTRLGGTIECHSVLGEGTEMLVRLPFMEVHD